MEATNIIQSGNTFQAMFHVPQFTASHISKKYIINATAVFQIKVLTYIANNNCHTNNNYRTNNNYTSYLIFVKFVKLYNDDDLTYIIKFTSHDLNIIDKIFTSDDGTWHLVHDGIKQLPYNLNLTVVMNIVSRSLSIAILHDDKELTDFELKGEDGSIYIHRLVLAAASPIFKSLLSGEWKNATEGKVDIPGTSRIVLQNFKDYLYLQTLPNEGLEQLLLLSSYYMIEDLEQRCVFKLVGMLTAKNTCHFLELAVLHKISSLLLAILERIQSGEVDVQQMRDNLLEKSEQIEKSQNSPGISD